MKNKGIKEQVNKLAKKMVKSRGFLLLTRSADGEVQAIPSSPEQIGLCFHLFSAFPQLQDQLVEFLESQTEEE